MNIINLEDFIEETWDYVSKYTVSDEYWEENNEYITEMTFEFYEIFRKSHYRTLDGDYIPRIKVKEFGKLLEIVFATTNKYQPSISAYWESTQEDTEEG